MSARAVAVDGLWLLLRPSMSRLLLGQSRHLRLLDNASLPSQKPFHTSSKHQSAASTHPTTTIQTHSSPEPKTSIPGADNGSKQAAPSKQGPSIKAWRPKEGKSARKLFRQRKANDLEDRNNVNLENLLQDVVGKAPNHTAALNVVTELIRHRNVAPDNRHYRAMLLANAQCIRGSSKQVEDLLKDMEDNNMQLDIGTLHAALRALAVHPDYLLRSDVMHKIQNRWMTISAGGWHSIVVACIRETQLEMALETLDYMCSQGIQIRPWLYPLIIYNLIDYEEFDEALRLLRERFSAGEPLSSNVWHRVLDAASTAMHADLTQFVWEELVETDHIIPSRGICSNVLAISTRTGNTGLATSVFKIMKRCDVLFKLSDYECLVDTYLEAQDIDSAIRTLSVMGKSGFNIGQASTRTLLSWSIATEMAPTTLWKIMKQLKDTEHREIPTVVGEVVLELCAHQSQAEMAGEIYREFRTVCSSGAETSTYNILFLVCRKAKHWDLAGTILQEMIQRSILPNRQTYENLVLLCVDFSQFKAAQKYLVEMTNSGFSLSDEAKKHVRVKCWENEDEAAKMLMHDSSVRKPASRTSIGPRPVQRANYAHSVSLYKQLAEEAVDGQAKVDTPAELASATSLNSQVITSEEADANASENTVAEMNGIYKKI